MTFRRVETVSGPRSYRLSLVGRWLFALWLVACAALFIAVIARPSDPDGGYFTTYFIVFWGWAGSAVMTGLLVMFIQIQMRRERQCGFTWSQDGYQNLNEVDPVSYVVIRAAGEELLAKEQRKDRIDQARAWATQNPVAT